MRRIADRMLRRTGRDELLHGGIAVERLGAAPTTSWRRQTRPDHMLELSPDGLILLCGTTTTDQVADELVVRFDAITQSLHRRRRVAPLQDPVHEPAGRTDGVSLPALVLQRRRRGP